MSEGEDNARLFAAAPDLLEALTELDRHLAFSVPPKIGEELILYEPLARALLKARAAIAKAEGRKDA